MGPSRRGGMGHRELSILQGITGELTRHGGKPQGGRPDGAHVVTGGVVPAALGPAGVGCPALDAQREFVAFNGNGSANYWGKGYRIVGDGGRGWL